jgi:hypothetical protein
VKVNKFLTLLLTIVSFASGVVVAFEWMGHDRGQRVYSMLKRPEVVTKEVEVIKYKPFVVSDDSRISLINEKYRESFIRISSITCASNTAKKELEDAQKIANEALKFPELVISISGDK